MQGDVRYPLFKVYEEGRRVRGKRKKVVWNLRVPFHQRFLIRNKSPALTLAREKSFFPFSELLYSQ